MKSITFCMLFCLCIQLTAEHTYLSSTSPDNLAFHLDQVCSDIDAVDVHSIVTTTALVSWEELGTATSWDIYYGVAPLTAPDGTTTPTETGITINTDHTISALSIGMDHEIYIRSDCGAGTEGDWFGPVSFYVPGNGQSCWLAETISVFDNCMPASFVDVQWSNAAEVNATSCNDMTPNYGFWYEFTATSRAIQIQGGAIDMEYAIFDSCDGTEVSCGEVLSGSNENVNGLTWQSTYYLQIYRDVQDAQISDFCLQRVVPNVSFVCDGAGNISQLNAFLSNHAYADITTLPCDIASWSNDFIAMSDECSETGSSGLVTFTATDLCSNTASFTSTFIIYDVPPNITTPAQTVFVEFDILTNDTDLNNWLNANGNAIATEVCGTNMYWSNDYTGLENECGFNSNTSVIFTVTDDCGLSSTTEANFVIGDSSCPGSLVDAEDMTVECDGAGNTAELNAWLAINGGADADANCGPWTWTNDFTGLSATCGSTGYTALVVFTATDLCMNVSTTSATFTIEDNVPPTIETFASPLTVNCDGAGNLTEINTWLGNSAGATASDVCSNITWSNNYVAPDDCGPAGTVVVTFFATDECGNTGATIATLTVIDNVAPNITNTSSDLNLECDGAGNTSEIDAWINDHGGAIADDVCSNVTWTHDYSGLSDDCAETGQTTVIFTATDPCGNTSTTSANILIEDAISPTIDTQASDLTTECDGAGNMAELNLWLATNGGAIATEICGSITWSNDFAGLSDDCGETGSATVIFTATDNCGNSSMTSAVFTIVDNAAPVISLEAGEFITECDGAGNVGELNLWLASNGGATATDVCGNITWSNDFTGLSDDCGETGMATVTFTATDECGNASMTTADFVVGDIMAPSIDIAASNELVECDGFGNNTELIAWLSNNGGAVASDNCGDIVWSNDFTSIDSNCGPDHSATVIFTATDGCGNSSTSSAIFYIETTCFDPSDLMINDATWNGATLSWLENGFAAMWEVEIVEAGSPLTETNAITVFSNSYTWQDGLPFSDYEFYVRALCYGPKESAWVGPFAFSTVCPSDDMILSGLNNGDNSNNQNLSLYQSGGAIITTQTIPSGVTIEYSAKGGVSFEPGFEIEAGANFTLSDTGCNPGG